MSRDWETVDRLDNWRRVFGPSKRKSAWGRPPFATLEEKLVLIYGHTEGDVDETGMPVPQQKVKQITIARDEADAEKVSRALCSAYVPARTRRILLTFYLATSFEWTRYGRLCRKAGTTRSQGERELIEAERFFGVVLRRFYD